MQKQAMILIVDDVLKNLQILGAILDEAGYEVAMADNGVSALETLNEIKPDLILLDIMMPEIDGFQVAERIKSDKSLCEIPIIFLTAKTEVDNIVKAFKRGAADYVVKPFNADELLARVKTHIDLRNSKILLKELNENLENKVAQRTKELEIANRNLSTLDHAKSYFLGLLSHELNTPITGIMGAIQLLKEEAHTADELEMLELAEESSERLKRFAQESLLIAKLQTEKYDVQPNKEDICVILNDIINDITPIAKKKDIKINNTISQCFFLHFDYALMKKCFYNIFDNAIKYSGSGTEIEIGGYEKNNQIVLEFLDEGNGFDDDTINNANNLFISDEIMHHKDGYGLGLSTVDLIMAAHSGKIEITNRKEKGALIRLIFNMEKG